MKRKSDWREGFQTRPKFKCQKEENQTTELGVIRKLAHKGAKQTRDDVCNRSPTQIALHVEKDEKKDDPWMRQPRWLEARKSMVHSAAAPITRAGGVNLMAAGRGGPSVHHWDNWHRSSSARAPLWKYYWQYLILNGYLEIKRFLDESDSRGWGSRLSSGAS